MVVLGDEIDRESELFLVVRLVWLLPSEWCGTFVCTAIARVVYIHLALWPHPSISSQATLLLWILCTVIFLSTEGVFVDVLP